jgi:hypothetical protein
MTSSRRLWVRQLGYQRSSQKELEIGLSKLVFTNSKNEKASKENNIFKRALIRLLLRTPIHKSTRSSRSGY